MVKEFRDGEDNILAYELTGEDKVKYEVSRAEDKARLGRLESHAEDTKNKLDKIDAKVTTMIDFIKNMIENHTAGMRRIDQAECRLKVAEDFIFPLIWVRNGILKLVPWVVSSATLAGLVIGAIKLFHW